MPEPIPRPTRFLLLFACLGALKLERFFAIISSLNAGWLCQSDSLMCTYSTIRTKWGTS